MNAPAAIREAFPLDDVTWWAMEAERVGTDWYSLIESHLHILATLGLIEFAPSSFEVACKRADDAASRRWGRR
jgi:hypothetical protein